MVPGGPPRPVPMALARRGTRSLDGDGCINLEVCAMRVPRFVLPLFFAVLATFVAVGLVFAFTRPIKWPANVRPIDWRRAVGADMKPTVEEEVAS
jgi:hypothetical protein